MCELLALSSRMRTRLTLSLEALAARSAPGRSLRDGWGAAFYEGRDAALYREALPASDSALVRLLREQGPHSALAICHLRHATLGARTLANTQPLQRELSGRTHVFAHNGHLPGLQAPDRSAHFQPVGDSDSERAFCHLLQQLRSLWLGSQPPSVQARLARVAEVAAELRALGPANFLYSDGELLFAHGHRRHQADGRITAPGLHLLTRRCTHDDEAWQSDGLCVDCGYQQLSLAASVPLSDEDWQPLAEGEIVVLRDGACIARA